MSELELAAAKSGRGAFSLRRFIALLWPDRRRLYRDYFDAKWYADANFGQQAGAVTSHAAQSLALNHYLSQGWRSGLSPSPYFDAPWYLEQNPHVAKSNMEPLAHYVTRGWREGRSPSVYFDAQWYMSRYPDVKESAIEPLFHYMRSGWREGRSPSVYFDTSWYLEKRRDVAATGMEPLWHYLLYGWRENCEPSIYFDMTRYKSQCATGVEPLKDYLLRGWRDGRSPGNGFDIEWYNRQRGSSETEPLKDYIVAGWRRGFSPSDEFKLQAYINAHPQSAVDGMEPFRHYLLSRSDAVAARGLAEHSRVARAPNTLRRNSTVGAPAQADDFALSSRPLVSIIVPNYNGAAHLEALFESLRAQTYENYEIVFMDDGSSDDSIQIAGKYAAEKIIRNGATVGFARTNNIGLSHCAGELIALLNNDMRVDSNWLEALVAEMRREPLIAAVAPKIRFWTKFQTLTFSSDGPFWLDSQKFANALEYKKYFVVAGVVAKNSIQAAGKGSDFQIVVHVPVEAGSIAVSLVGEDAQIVLVATISSKRAVTLEGGRADASLSFSTEDRREAYHIINNAGSSLDAAGNPGDRGFGHVDDGEYDDPAELDLFCGGAVLIRRDALHRRNLFIAELGAYYEDSELSIWLRDQGYKIAYCPAAIVYHKHSATNQEHSLFWLEHVSRNKAIFDYLAAPPAGRADALARGKLHLNHLMHWGRTSSEASETDRQLANKLPEILVDLDRIVHRIDMGDTPGSPGPRIGVYNSYWNTLGGGEAHALDVADALTQFGQVELISDRAFDLSRLTEYFGRKSDRFRKRLIARLTPAITSDYDIFVNSTYLSRTPSLAKTSFYIVSFPSVEAPEAFLESYHFLANSHYTLGHMQKFWGADKFEGSVLHPAVAARLAQSGADANMRRKEKIILSIGRFASSGHTKNQLEIVNAFRKVNEAKPELSRDWTLALAGSVNDLHYLAAVKDAGKNLNVDIFENADFLQISALYERAGVYVHASGYGHDPDKEPELFEHFGMVVAEAIVAGCYPIVYDAAGPKEIVEEVGIGRAWRTLDELVDALAETMARFNDGFPDLTASANAAERRFSSERQARILRNLVSSAGAARSNDRDANEKPQSAHPSD